VKKLLIAVALLALPSMVRAQGIGEILQGITDPHVVAGASYNSVTKTYSAVLTANVVGPKLGQYPIYLGGAGVSLNSLVAGLEDVPVAAASFPLVTVAPFGEKVVIQAGISIPLNGGPTAGKSYYAGLGLSVSGGPNALKAKRIKRIEAKKARKAALENPPAPQS